MKALWITSALCTAAALALAGAAWTIANDRTAAPPTAAPVPSFIPPNALPQINGWAFIGDKQWIYLAVNADRCDAVSPNRTLRAFSPMLRIWQPIGLPSDPREIAQLRCWRTGLGPALTPWEP